MNGSDPSPEYQAQVRAAQAGRSRAQAARGDRIAVLAVAAGDHLGLGDEDLAALRLRAYGVDPGREPRSPLEEALLRASARYDALVWPDAGNGIPEDEALRQIVISASDVAERAAADALRSVQPLIQPVAVEFEV